MTTDASSALLAEETTRKPNTSKAFKMKQGCYNREKRTPELVRGDVGYIPIALIYLRKGDGVLIPVGGGGEVLQVGQFVS